MSSIRGDEIRAIPHFADLSDPEAERLAQLAELRTYERRQAIILEGEPCTGFFVLRSGRARIFRTGPDGREQILRLLGPAETFGEVPMFDGGPNPASVDTIEPSEAIFISTATIFDVIRRHPVVAFELLRHFAARLRGFTELIEQISLQTVQSRIARYLYMSAREEGRVTGEGIVVARSLTQQDLAAFVGSVREVVSRTLRVMEDDGLVEVRRTEFVVRDLDALKRMV